MITKEVRRILKFNVGTLVGLSPFFDKSSPYNKTYNKKT